MESLLDFLRCLLGDGACGPGAAPPDGLTLLILGGVLTTAVKVLISSWETRLGNVLKNNLTALIVASILVLFFLLDPIPILLAIAALPLLGCLLFGGWLGRHKLGFGGRPIVGLDRAVVLSGLLIYGIGYAGHHLWTSNLTMADDGKRLVVVAFLLPAQHRSLPVQDDNLGTTEFILEKVFRNVRKVLIDYLRPIEEIEILPQDFGDGGYKAWQDRYNEIPETQLATELQEDYKSVGRPVHYAVQNRVDTGTKAESRGRLVLGIELLDLDPNQVRSRVFNTSVSGDHDRLDQLALVIGYRVAEFLLEGDEALVDTSPAETEQIWSTFSDRFKEIITVPGRIETNALPAEVQSVLQGEQICSTSDCVARLASLVETPSLQPEAVAEADRGRDTVAKSISIARNPRE